MDRYISIRLPAGQFDRSIFFFLSQLEDTTPLPQAPPSQAHPTQTPPMQTPPMQSALEVEFNGRLLTGAEALAFLARHREQGGVVVSGEREVVEETIVV